MNTASYFQEDPKATLSITPRIPITKNEKIKAVDVEPAILLEVFYQWKDNPP